MKYLLATLICLIFGCEIVAQTKIAGNWDNGGNEFPIHLMFDDKNVKRFGYDPEKGEKYEEVFPYVVFKKEGLSYVNFNKTDYLLVFYGEKAFRLFWSTDSEIYFRNSKNNKLFNREFQGHLESIYASSELTEGNTKFSIDKLINGEGIWASGNGFGIGDKIVIKVVGSITNIFMGNGYLSFSNPNLYGDNSRVKSIKIENKKINRTQVFSILDTYEPQSLNISNILDGSKNENEIEINILEVYPGKKFKDLCLWEIRGDIILE